MNLDIADRWIANLRSGEYQQGPGALKCRDQFCCLGVLSDMFIKENPDKAKWVRRPEDALVHFTFSDFVTKDEDSAFLPATVREWAGIKFPDKHHHDFYIGKLMTMNDQKISFNQIADYIDALKEEM